MATNRTRRSRTRGTGLNDQMKAAFSVGCGWNYLEKTLGREHLLALWKEHGRQYLNEQRADRGTVWGLLQFGEPEDA